jgi:hypothetical protein
LLKFLRKWIFLFHFLIFYPVNSPMEASSEDVDK